jgi:hypothetical protein
VGHVRNDVLTLWVEEIHNLNYAINDLKGGNIMIGRRGQLKEIDMDSYSLVSNALPGRNGIGLDKLGGGGADLLEAEPVVARPGGSTVSPRRDPFMHPVVDERLSRFQKK